MDKQKLNNYVDVLREAVECYPNTPLTHQKQLRKMLEEARNPCFQAACVIDEVVKFIDDLRYYHGDVLSSIKLTAWIYPSFVPKDQDSVNADHALSLAASKLVGARQCIIK